MFNIYLSKRKGMVGFGKSEAGGRKGWMGDMVVWWGLKGFLCMWVLI